MKRLLPAAIVAIALVVPGVIEAHHSFSAEFDFQKPIVLVGTLTRMEWINPHGWIYLDVKDKDGKVVNWAIEAGAPNALLRRGLRKTDFPLGVEVTVTGYLAKSGKPVANGRKVTFADGRDFFFGSSGNGAPDDGADGADKTAGRGER